MSYCSCYYYYYVYYFNVVVVVALCARRLDNCPASPSEFCKATFAEDPRHQTDVGQTLLEHKLLDRRLNQPTNTQGGDNIALIMPFNRVFDGAHNDAPPTEWANKLPGHPEFNLRHQISADHTINPTKDDRFDQRNQSTPKTQPHPATRGASYPKCSSKATSKATENINQTSKTNDFIIPVGTKNSRPSFGDTKECEVASQDMVPLQSSANRGRGGRKEGTRNRPKTMGQSGDHRPVAYAFADAFPPVARMLNIQTLGRSDKCWKELEITVRCYRLKEEKLIMRLLRLERLQNLTIEAERKRTNSAITVNQPKPNGVLEIPRRQSNDRVAADRKRPSVVWSRPMSACSYRDADDHQRKADVGARKNFTGGHARCSELNIGRASHGISSRANGRYAWQ